MKENRQDLLKKIGIDIPESEITLINWITISKSRLSENFIREFQDKLNWDIISSVRFCSEDFIREYKDKINWFSISSQQKLSEQFIREFQDQVDWFAISSNQDLSDDFIIEFKNRMQWDSYFREQYASFDIIKKFIGKTQIKNIKEIKNLHLKDVQKQEIKKIIILKNTFKLND